MVLIIRLPGPSPQALFISCPTIYPSLNSRINAAIKIQGFLWSRESTCILVLLSMTYVRTRRLIPLVTPTTLSNMYNVRCFTRHFKGCHLFIDLTVIIFESQLFPENRAGSTIGLIIPDVLMLV